jgi:hypothetical protein
VNARVNPSTLITFKVGRFNRFLIAILRSVMASVLEPM